MPNSPHQWTGPTIEVAVPPGRDPFVNTPLISLGKNAEGFERFWISSWNSNVGATAVLIDELGRERIYRFPMPHAGFYSAVLEDEDTLWLCGDLSRLVRLTLSSGEFETYETGAPSALVFQGMVIDKAQQKIFAIAYPPPHTVAFSFDYGKRQPVRVYHDVYENSEIALDGQAHYCRFGFSNHDGTYSLIAVTPGATLLRWDPREETLNACSICDIDPEKWQANQQGLKGYFYSEVSLIQNDAGQYYIPYLGWYDAAAQQLVDGPQPEQEMNWFARNGDHVWGSQFGLDENTVWQWEISSGTVRKIKALTNVTCRAVKLSESGKLIAVSLYGEFTRHDAHTGAKEIARRLPTDSIGAVDCLCRIDEERLLGTPFITQRFWEVNLKTGHGYDCGRASSSSGEVLLTWKVNGKIYMATYTQGLLTEYDPGIHPHYPENPLEVAQVPGGMRPLSGFRIEDDIYFSCSHHYGNLGCVLTKFNTTTGQAFYCDDPLPGLCINTWHYHEPSRSIIAGTTIHADCRSCPPTEERNVIARLCPDTLQVLQVQPSSAKNWMSLVYGQLDDKSYLVENFGEEGHKSWQRLDAATLEMAPLIHAALENPELSFIKYSGKPGYYIWRIEGRFELWDMNRMESVMVLYSGEDVHHCHAQDDSVYLVKQKEILILEDCLKNL